jgi:CheY-like chemotaxis protein
MGKKILLADDSITIQKVIELTFSDEDFDVVTVGNGRLAIEKAQEVRPDIVLCDIIMPEKDGYEVCDFIKKSPVLSQVPVLLLTGAFEPFDQERAARVGCDGFLAKPFEPQTLIAKVKDLLNQAASRQPVAAAPRPALPPPPMAEPGPETYPVVPESAFEPEFPSFDAGTSLDDEPHPPAFDPIVSRTSDPDATLIPEEPSYLEASPVEEIPPTFADAVDIAGEPEPPSPYVSMSAPEPEPDVYSMGDAFEASPEDLMPISPEDEAQPSIATPLDDASTVMFPAVSEPSPWSSQSTAELPLEARAQAGVESAQLGHETASVFEEVFEEAEVPTLPLTPPPPLASTLPPTSFAPPPPSPAPMPPPVEARPAAPAPPAPAALPPQREAPGELSFADLAPRPAAAPPKPAAGAAEVAVPMDMVAQIAQRVVAQISEKVVREVAWEVIPDLAEALIKREIERLKAELQQT